MLERLKRRPNKNPRQGIFMKLHFFNGFIGNKIRGSFRGVAEALQEAVKIMILIQIKKTVPKGTENNQIH